jgi:predicted ferric reductase
MTWFHILNEKNVTAIVLMAIISVLWLGTFILWAVFLQSRNESLSGTPIYSFKRVKYGGTTKLYRVKIALQSQRTIAPGQYFYLIHKRKWWHFFQSHPYMVAWENKKNGTQYVYFLIECQKGFSSRFQEGKSRKEVENDHKPKCSKVYMDGPYGGHLYLRNYDTVFFISRGIGIASQLLLIRDLLRAHNNLTARVRRVTLLWVDCDGKLPSSTLE